MVNVDKFENLPLREGRGRYLTRVHGDMWDLRRFDDPCNRSTKSDYAWVKVKRVIKKFMGKSFADAFSYYCKLVDQHEQKEFLDVFKNKRRSWYEPDYIINEDGNIALNPDRYIRKTKNSFYIRSFDYEEGYMKKSTGELFTLKEYTRLFRVGDLYYYNPQYERCVIKGYERYFDSKKDLEYIRLRAENEKGKKLNRKDWKKYNRHKALCFLTDDELQKQQDRIEGIAIRDRHGFDENSFKGDPYHGQQRKNK